MNSNIHPLPSNVVEARKALSCYDVVLDFVEERLTMGGGTATLHTHDIEQTCRDFGRKRHGKVYSSSTYRRRWQELRKSGEEFAARHIVVEALPFHPQEGDRKFIVRRTSADVRRAA